MADVHAALTASKSNPQNFVLAEPSHPVDPVFHFFYGACRRRLTDKLAILA